MMLRFSLSAKPAAGVCRSLRSPAKRSPDIWGSTRQSDRLLLRGLGAVATPTLAPASTSSSPRIGRETLTAIAIVDTGPLYAAADERDSAHGRSIAVLQRPDLHLVIPGLVIAEASYLVGQRLGPQAEASFTRDLADFDVEAPTPADRTRMADLMERYADFSLGATDASVIALAERLDTDLVITLDHRHFVALRPSHRDSLALLPG